MSDVTDKAAAVLLYKTTMDTLRICRGSDPGKSGKILALCATPELVDVMRYNATLLDALVFDYATRVAADMPPPIAKPETAPTKEFAVNLLEPEPEK